MVRKVQFFGLAFVALCALGAMLSTTAFALTYTLAEWLVSGVAVAKGTKVVATWTGGLTFEDTTDKGSLLCTGISDGFVLEDGEGEITKLLNAAGTEEMKVLDEEGEGSKGMVCTGVSLCSSAEAWPITLPILTLLELAEPEGTFEVLVLEHEGRLPGDFALCETIFGMVDELCEVLAESGGAIKSATGGAEATGSIEPLGTCGAVTVSCNGAAETGLVTADEGNHLTSEGLEVEPSE